MAAYNLLLIAIIFPSCLVLNIIRCNHRKPNTDVNFGIYMAVTSLASLVKIFN